MKRFHTFFNSLGSRKIIDCYISMYIKTVVFIKDTEFKFIYELEFDEIYVFRNLSPTHFEKFVVGYNSLIKRLYCFICERDVII